MTDQLTFWWENAVLRTAAFTIAAGVLWRYVLLPVVRAAVRGYRRVSEALHWIEQVNTVVSRELTTNGGKSVKDVAERALEHALVLREEVRDMRGEVSEMTAEVASLAGMLGDHQRVGHRRRDDS